MKSSVLYVTERIIDQIYKNENSKAVLAGLRQTKTILSPRAQVLWPFLIANLKNEECCVLSQGGVPTREEVAIYEALRLYAIHQQSVDICVHRSCSLSRITSTDAASKQEKPLLGKPFFKAFSELRNDETKKALDRRMRSFLGTTHPKSVFNMLVHLVGILKASEANFQVDYALLASDLYWFQYDYTAASRVRLQWGRDYYSGAAKLVNNEEDQVNEK